MKKILTIVLVLMMVLSLMACKSKTIEDSTLKENPPIVGEIFVDSLSAPFFSKALNTTNPTYNDKDVTIEIDDDNGFVFLGDTSIDWEIEGYDDGVIVMQDGSLVAVYPQLLDTELTTSIIGSNDVKYFLTFIEYSDNTIDVNVERLVMDEVNPMCGIYYTYD